jgi:hypothetical protein
MLTTYDIESVRRFADEVENQWKECDGSSFCSDLDQHIHCLAAVCEVWQNAVRDWAIAVFAGKVEFDPKVEAFFKGELRRVANQARPHVQHGREVQSDCHNLERLNDLELMVTEIDFLLANWVRPQRSIAPGPRVQTTQEAAEQIATKVQSLPPLPADTPLRRSSAPRLPRSRDLGLQRS